jgi:hypothetical protein
VFADGTINHNYRVGGISERVPYLMRFRFSDEIW